MADIEPQQDREQHPEMHRGVVDVARLHEERVPNDRPLQRDLIRKMPRALVVPNPLSAPHCLVGVPKRYASGDLPKRVQAEDDADLAAKWRDLEDHGATVRRETLP